MLARAVVVQEGIPDGVRRVGAYQCAQECEHEWYMTLCVGAWRMAMHMLCASPLLGSPSPVPGEQCCRASTCGEVVDVVLPSLNRATKHSQPQPTSSPRLDTQFLPTSLE